MQFATAIEWRRAEDFSTGALHGQGRLAFTLETTYGYQISGAGDPIRALGPTPAVFQVALEGELLALPDGEGGYEVRPAGRSWIHVRPTSWNDASPDELLAALMGLHPAQAGVSVRESLQWASLVCLQPSPGATRPDWVQAALARWSAGGADPVRAVAALRRIRNEIAAASSRVLASAVAARLAGSTIVVRDLASAVWTEPVVAPVWLGSDLLSATVRTSQGILVVEQPGEPAIQGALRHAFQLPAHAPVRLEACASLPVDHAVGLLAQANLPAPPFDGSGDAELRLAVTLRAGSLQRWLALPPERSWDHFELAARLSVRLQQSLRRWIPAAALSAPGAYQDHPVAAALMAYRASRPFRPRSRAAYTYDPHEAAHVQSFCRGAESGLNAALGQLKKELRDAGQHKLAERYIDRNITRHVKPRSGVLPKPISALLAAEGAMLEDLFCATARTAGETAAPPRMPDLVKPLTGGLRKAARPHQLEWLAPLALADLTRVLAPDDGSQTVIELETKEGLSAAFFSEGFEDGR